MEILEKLANVKFQEHRDGRNRGKVGEKVNIQEHRDGVKIGKSWKVEEIPIPKRRRKIMKKRNGASYS